MYLVMLPLRSHYHVGPSNKLSHRSLDYALSLPNLPNSPRKLSALTTSVLP